MKKFTLALFAVAVAFALTPAVFADNFTLTFSGYTGTDGFSTLPDAAPTSIGSDTPFSIQILFNTSSAAPTILGPGTVQFTPLTEEITVGGTPYTATVESGDIVGLTDSSWCFIICPVNQYVEGFVQGNGANGIGPAFSATTTAGWNVTTNFTSTTFPVADYIGEDQSNTLFFTIAGDPNTLNIDYDTSIGLTATLTDIPEGGASWLYLLLAAAVTLGALRLGKPVMAV
jgi:hypothetical protein